MTTTFTTDQFSDFVNEWVANNPERLNCLFGDTTGFLNWKRRATTQSATRTEEGVNGSSYTNLAERFQIRRAKMYVAEVCARLADETETALR